MPPPSFCLIYTIVTCTMYSSHGVAGQNLTQTEGSVGAPFQSTSLSYFVSCHNFVFYKNPTLQISGKVFMSQLKRRSCYISAIISICRQPCHREVKDQIKRDYKSEGRLRTEERLNQEFFYLLQKSRAVKFSVLNIGD